MTVYTPILNMPQVAPNQNQKETTINTDLAILEAACNDVATFSLASGGRTLTVDDYTKNFFMKFTGHTVVRSVQVPNTVRFFAVSNEGTASINMDVLSISDTPITIEADKRVLLYNDGTKLIAISAGVSSLANLSDVVGAGDASNGQLLAYDASGDTWGPVDNAGDHTFFVEGEPTASKKVYVHIFARNGRLLSDFSGSQGKAAIAATGVSVFNVYKNATLVGTLNVAAAATTVTFSTDTGSGSATVTFAPGDLLTVQAPSSPDATLADIAVTLKGVLF